MIVERYIKHLPVILHSSRSTPMEQVLLDVLNLYPSPAHEDLFILLLSDTKGHRHLPMLLGTMEAQAIALALEQRKMERPLTHDLFGTVLKRLGYTVQKVLIKELKRDVFQSDMTLSNGKTTVEVDARPSDAIALGLRFAANLYISNTLLEDVHVFVSDISPSADVQSIPLEKITAATVRNHSIIILQETLQEAVKQEAYDQAILLRDEINRRKSAN